MRLKSFAAALIFLLGGSLAVQAQTASDALIQQLYAKSGLQKQVQQIPGSVEQAFDQRLAASGSARRLDSHLVSALKKSLQLVFVPAAMKKAILAEFRAGLSRDDIEKTLAWLNSPHGKKITRLEEQASTPEAARAMPLFLKTLQSQPPTAERLKAIKKLDKAAKATETVAEISIATALATITALDAVSPMQRDGKRPSINDLRASLDAARPQMEAAIRQQLHVYFLYTYRSLTGPELDRYIAFVQSDTGKKYYDVATAGLSKALFASILDLETALANEFNSRKL